MKHPLLMALAKEAPSVRFAVSRTIDDSYKWDGFGPDPANEGYFPYDIDVSAKVIVDGDFIETHAYLGCYYWPTEKIGDVHGYLPQLLLEATNKLLKKINPVLDFRLHNLFLELNRAKDFLEMEMRRQYDAQMKS